MSQEFWSTRRRQYRSLCALCQLVDDAISKITVVSFSNNLFFICVQLLRSLKWVVLLDPNWMHFPIFKIIYCLPCSFHSQADAIFCSCILLLVLFDIFDGTNAGGVFVCSTNLWPIEETDWSTTSCAERFVVFGCSAIFRGSNQPHGRIVWHAFLLFDATTSFECEASTPNQKSTVRNG